MPKGAFDQFIIRKHNIETFTQVYERVLWEYGFVTKEKSWDGRIARHKAIWGDKATAFAMSHIVPFGSLFESGNRYGAEAEIYQHGPDLIFRLLVVQYMSIFDNHDYFLISQGIFEKILDDDRCRQKLSYIINRLMDYQVPIFRY
jgi:hypothetical protein